jgi:hypothetical protein
VDLSGSRPNASATCGASVMNGEGLATERHRRRRVYQKMRPTSSVPPRMPPTTPPAIAPVFELLLFEVELVEELGAAVDDVDVDELVDGVPSGVSFNREKWKES